MMDEGSDDDPVVERIARMLAGAAGQVWDQLHNHPGFYRTYWRGEARRALGLPEPLPAPRGIAA